MANDLLSAALGFARRSRFVALALVALSVGFCAPHAARSDVSSRPSVDTRGVIVPNDVWMVAAWLVRYNVNKGQPFIIADKVDPSLYAFDKKGKLLGVSPALFGAA